MIARSDLSPDSPSSASPLVRQLWPADVSRLRLAEHSRLDEADAAALVIQSPGSSFWLPETGEFLLVTPWRHRPDITTIHTFGAFSHEPELMAAVIGQGRQGGYAALVIVDINETRHPAFYARHGLTRIEDVVTYEHRRPGQMTASEISGGLDFKMVDPNDASIMSILLAMDHEAFPWLWRNSPSEFESYLRFPGVEVWMGFDGAEPVCYAGITNYHGWGHLDRIATRPRYQGRGYGRVTLRMAVQRMVERGARRVGLSTQGENARSRALYKSTGFNRTPEDDYAIYAVMFGEPRVSLP